MKKDNVLYVLFKPFYFKAERKTVGFYHDYLSRKSNSLDYLSELEEELMTKKKESFDEMVGFYESAIDHFLSTDFLTAEELGSLGENGIDGTKAFMKSMFVRRWMR